MSALLPKAAVEQTSVDVANVPRATERIAANSALFDHFVSQQLHRYRYIDAERLGGLHVDDQLEPGGLLDGEVGGLGALEDLVHVHRAAPKQVVDVGAIGDETADLDKLAGLGHGRQSVRCGKLDNASSREEEHRARKQEQRLGTLFHHRRECALKLFHDPHHDQLTLHSRHPRGGLCCLQHV